MVCRLLCKRETHRALKPVTENTHMAATATFTCVCGIQKGPSNHWILATRTANTIRFIPWDWSLAFNDDVVVLCGEGCAAALLSRSMGEWKEKAVMSAMLQALPAAA